MSSSGADTIVPSGSFFDAAFGPSFSNGSSITSTSAGPSVSKISGSFASSTWLFLSRKYGNPYAAAIFSNDGRITPEPASDPMKRPLKNARCVVLIERYPPLL